MQACTAVWHVARRNQKDQTCNCQSLRSSYKSALQKLGLPFDSALIHEVPPSLSGSYESTKSLLRQGVTFPSAMLAVNDCIALGGTPAGSQDQPSRLPLSEDDDRRGPDHSKQHPKLQAQIVTLAQNRFRAGQCFSGFLIVIFRQSRDQIIRQA